MQLHQLSGNRKQTRTRVGRGGKRGTTSGRGTKGQKSRSGHVIRPAIRDLINRIPKRRGFRNKPKSDASVVLSLAEIALSLKPLAEKGKVLTVNRAVLVQAGLLSKRITSPLKIMFKGSIDFPIALQKIKASDGAKAAIEKAGGSVS